MPFFWVVKAVNLEHLVYDFFKATVAGFRDKVDGN